MFIPWPGVTFLVPSPRGYHLNFILTPPVPGKNLEEVLVVGITSTEIDPKFTLDRGDHPFIKHKSYIDYAGAEILSVADIRRKLENGVYKLKEISSPEVVKYICRGLLESSHSLPQHRKFYREFQREKSGT